MKIISLVANGFQNDNRVERMAKTIQNLGHEVIIVGWKKETYRNTKTFRTLPFIVFFLLVQNGKEATSGSD